ncbi:RING/U-box superfamily protein [Trifolium repens]|jgi:hypothetical protein|nr:RING/U-box superfamily protein [Trifolium repens]
MPDPMTPPYEYASLILIAFNVILLGLSLILDVCTQRRRNQRNNALVNHNQQNSRPNALHEDRAHSISNNHSFQTVKEITRWTIIRSLPPVKSFQDEKNMDCPVCMEEFKKGELIQPFRVCNHEFHVSCLFSWLHNQGKTTCPVCRQDLFI